LYRGLAVLLASLVAAIAAPAATAPPAFGPLRTVTRVSSDGWLSEIGVADVTGDGIADIVGVRLADAQGTRPIVVLAGNGKAGFRDVTAQVFDGPPPRTQLARHILFADFNRDGVADIFIADTGADSNPFRGFPNTLVLSAPGGKLVDASANLPAEIGFTHAVAVGDVNHDGAPDLYLGNICCGAPPRVLLNDGSGHFSRLQNALPDRMNDVFNGPRYTASAFADVNGDGWDDLVLAAEDHTPTSEVLVNDQHGHLVPLAGALPPKPFGPDAIGLAVAPVKLNGDGHIDLVIAFTRGNPFYRGRWLQMLINNGNGTFRDETATRLPQQEDLSAWPYALRIADLNRDGKPDLAVALNDFSPGELPPVYANRGDGTFALLKPPPAGFAMLALADVDGDARADIVSVLPGGPNDTFAVNLQRGSIPKPKPKKKKCVKRPHHRCR
jgi:hypothetical protein